MRYMESNEGRKKRRKKEGKREGKKGERKEILFFCIKRCVLCSKHSSGHQKAIKM